MFCEGAEGGWLKSRGSHSTQITLRVVARQRLYVVRPGLRQLLQESLSVFYRRQGLRKNRHSICKLHSFAAVGNHVFPAMTPPQTDKIHSERSPRRCHVYLIPSTVSHVATCEQVILRLGRLFSNVGRLIAARSMPRDQMLHDRMLTGRMLQGQTWNAVRAL
jgi:hypothetical protein